MPADLVVDASGRGSRAGAWLSQLGFPTVSQSTIRVDMVYVHRHYRSEPGLLDGKLAVSFTASPGQPRSANVLRQEGGRFALALTGMLGEEPPTDPVHERGGAHRRTVGVRRPRVGRARR